MNPHQVSRRSFLRKSALTSLGVAAAAQARGQSSDPIWLTGNDKIDHPRKVAIDLLKPTQAQLERAWELHFDSLVFESYGFAPRCAMDGDRIQAAVKAGASHAELTDIREETMMNRCATDDAEREEFLQAFRAAGVDCIFQNAGQEGNDPMRLIKRLAHFTRLTDLMQPTVSKAVTAADVQAAKDDGNIALSFATNGVPLRMNWESVRDELRYVRIFQELGVGMMHLTYNRRNPLGDGAGEPKDGGLSDFGHTAVAEMNRLGVIVDVAHSGWTTSLEAAKASTKPMVASHTTCQALNDHYRAKPDEVIKAICDTDGLVGMCCISKFLGGDGDLNRLLDHIDHMVKGFGAEHCAIGADVAYVSRNDGRERLKIGKLPNGSSPMSGRGDRWEHLWPAYDYSNSVEARESICWTNWPMFTLGMVVRGHSDEDIRKILGGNTLRVLKANAGA
ncbi:MAG: membrane dipeptidase [Verrucomicrobiales bacterium]|jgi:membrane dipeptidase